MSWSWSTVEVWAAIGQCLSALAAVCALVFVGFQIKAAQKTADLQSLQTFYQEVVKREQQLSNAQNDKEKDQAFVEFLNFMELHAAALNGNLFENVGKRIVVEKLRDCVVILQENDAWHANISGSMTSETTFNSLLEFIKNEKTTIDKIIRARDKVILP